MTRLGRRCVVRLHSFDCSSFSPRQIGAKGFDTKQSIDFQARKQLGNPPPLAFVTSNCHSPAALDSPEKERIHHRSRRAASRLALHARFCAAIPILRLSLRRSVWLFQPRLRPDGSRHNRSDDRQGKPPPFHWLPLLPWHPKFGWRG